MIPMIAAPLVHTAVVERSTAAGESPSRQRLPARWAVHLEAMPCTFWQPEKLPLSTGSSGLREGPNVVVVSDGPRLLVARTADVGVGDRIREVRAGETVLAVGPMPVVDDLMRRSHRELALEKPGARVTPAEAS
jgi:hypothetical protein